MAATALLSLTTNNGDNYFAVRHRLRLFGKRNTLSTVNKLEKRVEYFWDLHLVKNEAEENSESLGNFSVYNAQ